MEIEEEFVEPEGPTCTICLQVMCDPSHPSFCDHSFCFKCIRRWMDYKQVCPLCIQTVSAIVCVRPEGKFVYPVKAKLPQVVNLGNHSRVVVTNFNLDQVNRLVPWLREEIECISRFVFFNKSMVFTVITQLLSIYPMDSICLAVTVRQYFRGYTDIFISRLNTFLASPFELDSGGREMAYLDPFLRGYIDDMPNTQLWSNCYYVPLHPVSPPPSTDHELLSNELLNNEMLTNERPSIEMPSIEIPSIEMPSNEMPYDLPSNDLLSDEFPIVNPLLVQPPQTVVRPAWYRIILREESQERVNIMNSAESHIRFRLPVRMECSNEAVNSSPVHETGMISVSEEQIGDAQTMPCDEESRNSHDESESVSMAVSGLVHTEFMENAGSGSDSDESSQQQANRKRTAEISESSELQWKRSRWLYYCDLSDSDD